MGRGDKGYCRVEEEEGWDLEPCCAFILSISFLASSVMIEVADPEATGATGVGTSMASKVGMKDGTYAGGFRGFLLFVEVLVILCCSESFGRE